MKESNPLDFAEYISSYGPKVPSKMDEIYIGLHKEKFLDLSAEQLEKQFSISPRVEGTFSFRNDQLLSFKPSSSLQSNQNYTISLNLKDIVQQPNLLPSQTFSFICKTSPQHVQLSVKETFAKNNTWYTTLQIRLEDKEALSTIMESLLVKQDGTALDFTLNALSPYMLEAVIEGVDVDATNSSLKFTMDKKKMALSESVMLEYQLPDPSIFQFIKAYSDEGKSTFVFSKILDKTQNLNGLIQMDDQKKSPKYSIDGNRLIVFHDRKNAAELQTIHISEKLKNRKGDALGVPIHHTNDLNPIKPVLKNVGKGHILPSEGEVVFPFEAQGLHHVRLEIFKIYSNNLRQFYQQNTLSNYYGLEYVGEVVYTERLDLNDLSNQFDPSLMQAYYFNLKDFIQQEENAVYEIRLGFVPEDVIIPCANELEYDPEWSDRSIFESSYYGIAGRYDGFDWNDRDNPCKLGYYGSNKYIDRLIMASNIGIIAKKANNGDLQIVINDISSAAPIDGAEVYVFNKAQKLLLESKTDKQGFLTITDMNDAHLIQVKYKNDENWIRITNRDALSMSTFNVGGKTRKDGIDGFIYGERNIWRPGDTMYMDFILFDGQSKLPKDHPVKLSLENSQGKTVFSKRSTDHNGPIYPFTIPTKYDYITGDYLVHVQVGGNRFSKFVKIENIKPNKFSIQSTLETADLNRFKNQIYSAGQSFDYEVNWLYGAPAKNKRLEVQLSMANASTSFDQFPDYQFTDPRNEWSAPADEMIAETTTDEEGKASVKLKLDANSKPRGKVRLNFKNTAYEASGDFSTESFSSNISPYERYVGIRLPKDDYQYNRVSKGQKAEIEFASVNFDGDPTSNAKLDIQVYKMENYWWYNSYNNAFDMTNMSSHVSQHQFEESTDSRGKAAIDIVFNSRGRYYIQVCDQESGHCSGDYLYVGYAWDDEEMTDAQFEEAAQLILNPVQSSYKKGETVEILVPSYFEGQALVSLENGDKIVESFWTKVQRGNNKIRFTAQIDMFPTIYVHVSLLQQHADKANDMPIRLYGVVPVQIDDVTLLLKPSIKMPSELKPKQKFELSIEEDKNREMYYTVAIVEEGLLNLTGFKTPDPFKHFYSKPSLGVRTFDMYNEVLSSYGTEVTNLLSIGGDMENITINEDTRANRFRPVVRHLGPFYLGSGAQNTHQIELPNYIGSVRVMVVAAEGNAFGNAQKQVPVKQDLMLLATMPRSLSIGDRLDLPINIFTMKENMGQIDYGVEQDKSLVIFEQQSASTRINGIGEQMEKMFVQVGAQEGIEKLGFYAKSSKNTATQEIEIDVINPNPTIHRSDSKYLEPGQTFTWTGEAIGSETDLRGTVSSLAPINIEDQINRLSAYPYGCLEQRISAAFALLHQSDLIETEGQQQAYAKTVVQDVLSNLYRYQQLEGYGLWPGTYHRNDWLTSYIGDFLSLAKNKGYDIPKSTLNHWKSAQESRAASWSLLNQDQPNRRRYSILNQAYRLYSMALHGFDVTREMNRLKEDHVLSGNSTLFLAAAYAKLGRQDVANSLLEKLNDEDLDDAAYDNNTYSNYPRNLALQIILLDQLGKKEKVASVAKSLSDWASKNTYMSTHTAAFVLRALTIMNRYFGNSKNIQINYQQDNGTVQSLSSEGGSISIQSSFKNQTTVTITNRNEFGVYASLTRSGKERLGEEKAGTANLFIETKYLDLQGKAIDPTSLAQGTDVRVITRIRKPALPSKNYSDLALRQIFPSGWEILNDRIFNPNQSENGSLDYQDFKDNQVNSFFSLENKNEVQVEVLVKATYQGRFYHPKMICESMYEDDLYAESKGFECAVYE